MDEEENIIEFNEKNCELISVELVKKYTQPKKEFTESSLLAFMKNPSAENTDEKLVGLGTPATRASIIQKLQKHEYLIKKGKSFFATDKGFFLLRLLFKNPLTAQIAGIERTTQWEKNLEQNPQVFEESIIKYIAECCSQISPTENYTKPEIGKCPLCGGKMFEGKKSYFCENWNKNPTCKFSVWKQICSADISANDVSLLLSGKKTRIKKMKNKKGSLFYARLSLDSKSGSLIFSYENKK